MTGTAPNQTAPISAPTETATTTTAAPDPAVANKPPQEKDQFSEKLELISKRERQMWRQRQSLEQEKQQLAADRAEYEKFKAIKANAKQNPNAYLSEGGLSYDDVTSFNLNGGKPTQEDELQTLRDQFKQLKEDQAKEKEDARAAQIQSQQQAEAQAIEGFKEDISSFLEEKKEIFEMCHRQGDIGVNDIVATINLSYKEKLKDWHKGGRIGRPPGPMSIEDAAKIQEEFYEKEIIEFAKLGKIQAKLAPQPQSEGGGGGQSPKQPSKTLTNNMASTAASVIPAKNDNDRMLRAMRALEGQKG